MISGRSLKYAQVGVPEWSVQKVLDHQKQRGIAYTFLSLTAPGTSIMADRDGARSLARDTNEYCSRVVKENPTKLGLFAALPPLTDTEGAMYVYRKCEACAE